MKPQRAIPVHRRRSPTATQRNESATCRPSPEVFHCPAARRGLPFASAFPTDLLPRHTMSRQPLLAILIRGLLLSLALAAANRPVWGQAPDIPKSEARYAV